MKAQWTHAVYQKCSPPHPPASGSPNLQHKESISAFAQTQPDKALISQIAIQAKEQVNFIQHKMHKDWRSIEETF